MRTLCTISLVLLLSTSVFAADFLSETEAIAERVELSIVGGSMGMGLGFYWPVVRSTKTEASLGVMAAIGDEAAGAGLGLRTPVKIDLPVVSEIVDYFGVGRSYHWSVGNWQWDYWIGNEVKVSW